MGFPVNGQTKSIHGGPPLGHRGVVQGYVSMVMISLIGPPVVMAHQRLWSYLHHYLDGSGVKVRGPYDLQHKVHSNSNRKRRNFGETLHSRRVPELFVNAKKKL